MKKHITFKSKKIPAEYLLSKKGLESLKQKLSQLRSQRKEQVSAMAALREQQSNDVAVEDASYIYAKSLIESIDVDIERLEHIVQHADVITSTLTDKEEVMLGSHVKLEANGRSFEYTIVHSLEADPSSGKISSDSPLGRLLIGRRLWDKITFNHSHRRKPVDLKLVDIS